MVLGLAVLKPAGEGSIKQLLRREDQSNLLEAFIEY